MNTGTININSPVAIAQENFKTPGGTAALPDYLYFEQQYLLLRTKENRIYSDEELISLPDISKRHPHYKEWRLRKNSFSKLKSYLKKKKSTLEILEVGCGNGWLCNQLSMHVSCHVTAIDINRPELEQAASVFRQNARCSFMYGDVRSGILDHKKFDIIIFAASLQYFQSLDEILGVCLQRLHAGGEIHIIDTHFYKDLEIEEARQRSKSHFNALGFPGMSAMYFHHGLNDIKKFNPDILYDPRAVSNWFSRGRLPFYWIRIANHKRA